MGLIATAFGLMTEVIGRGHGLSLRQLTIAVASGLFHVAAMRSAIIVGHVD